MNEKFSADKAYDNDSTLNTEERDYKNLINKLKKISTTIALLEKKYLDKF